MAAFLLLALFFSGCATGTASTEEAWAACLTNDAKACRSLQGDLRRCADGACAAVAAATPADVAHLARNIGRGVDEQTEVAFELRRFLDGGALEDVDRALATLASEAPELLLQMFQKHQLDVAEIERLVCMLPLSTVDDSPARLHVVEQRLAALRGVRTSALASVRETATGALEAYRDRLKSRR